jgi:hypothetical protein
MQIESAELDILVHLTGSEIVTFKVKDEYEARHILGSIVPGKFFEPKQLVIGCKNSLSAFQTDHITQVELISDHVPDWSFHHNVRMIREVSPQAFREKYAHIEHVDRSLSDVVHVSSEIELSNGEKIYLTLDVNSDPAISPLTPLDQHVFIQQLFSSHCIFAHHRDRGVVLINPAHISRLTMHPGPEAVPAGTWHASMCKE